MYRQYMAVVSSTEEGNWMPWGEWWAKIMSSILSVIFYFYHIKTKNGKEYCKLLLFMIFGYIDISYFLFTFTEFNYHKFYNLKFKKIKIYSAQISSCFYHLYFNNLNHIEPTSTYKNKTSVWTMVYHAKVNSL